MTHITIIVRFEKGSYNMSYAETSTYCRVTGDIQLRGDVIHGV